MMTVNPDLRRIIHELGLDPAAIERVETISERHGHGVWRLVTAGGSYVLKWMPGSEGRVEVEGYRLLRKLGVPTLPLYGSTDQALLLEDLGTSERWRLADEDDVARAEVGRAVARWYRVFHDAGEKFLRGADRPDFLSRETEDLTPETILETGRALGLTGLPVWKLVADHIDLLKAAVERLSLTLNYNDFYWTNLALLRGPEGEPEAVVFDYHLLGLGMRVSDVRNVRSALAGDAIAAFGEAYGAVDPREAALDRPLATLYGLHVAARRDVFPRWAEAARKRAIDGSLERDLGEAVTLVRLFFLRSRGDHEKDEKRGGRREESWST